MYINIWQNYRRNKCNILCMSTSGLQMFIDKWFLTGSPDSLFRIHCHLALMRHLVNTLAWCLPPDLGFLYVYDPEWITDYFVILLAVQAIGQGGLMGAIWPLCT